MSLQGNYTAEIVAYARARASLYRDPSIRNSDYLSRQFLNRMLTIALYPGLRSIAKAIYDLLTPGIYLFLHLRGRHFDYTFEQELREGIEQLVIVGSGMDSRPYRYRDRLKGVRVFECDHPATARLKQERLQRWGGDTSHVTYVNVDLIKESLAQKLSEAGFDKNAKSLILCEGIFYYLAEDVVVEKILEVVARTRTGTSLLFDYVLRDVYVSPDGHFGARELVRYLERRKEPIRSTIDYDEIETFLRPYGLELLSNDKATSLVDKYLRRRNGRLLGRICAAYGLAHARRI